MKFLIIDDRCDGLKTIYHDHGSIQSENLIITCDPTDLYSPLHQYTDEEASELPLQIEEMEFDGILYEVESDEISFMLRDVVVATYHIIHQEEEYKHTSIYMVGRNDYKCSPRCSPVDVSDPLDWERSPVL